MQAQFCLTPEKFKAAIPGTNSTRELAAKLGVSRTTIYEAVRRYGIKPPWWKVPPGLTKNPPYVKRSKKVVLAIAVTAATDDGCQTVEDVAAWLEEHRPEVADTCTSTDIRKALDHRKMYPQAAKTLSICWDCRRAYATPDGCPFIASTDDPGSILAAMGAKYDTKPDPSARVRVLYVVRECPRFKEG